MKQPIRRKKWDRMGLLFAVILVLVVMFIPLFHLPGLADPVQAPRLLLLGILLSLSIVLILLIDKRSDMRTDFLRSGVILSLLAYLLFSVLSMIFAVNSREGLFDIGKTMLSFLTMVLFSYLLIRKPENLHWLIRLFIITVILLSVIGLAQYLMHVSGRMGESMYARLYMVRGFSGHKVAYSILLFLSLPMVIYGVHVFKGTWRMLSLTALLIALVMIIITQTRAVWIGCAVGLLIVSIYFATFRIRKGQALFSSGLKLIFYPILIVLLAGVVYFTTSPGFRKVVGYQLSGMADADNVSNLPRISILASTLEMIADHPVTGVGAGNWKIALPPYQYDYIYYMTDHRHPEVRFQNWIRPHNDPVWILSEKGPAGLMAYLALFILLFLMGNRIIFNKADGSDGVLAVLVVGALGGYLVLSVFSFPLERIDIQIYLMILMALLVSLEYRDKQSGATRAVRALTMGVASLAVVLSVATAVYAVYMIRAERDLNRLVMDSRGEADQAGTMNAILSDASLVTLDPFANPLKYYVGVREMKSGDPAGAMYFFQEAYRVHPNNVNLLLAMMKACIRTGDMQACKRYGKELLDIFPFHKEGLMTLAMVHFMEGNYNRSLQTLLAVKNRDNTVDQAILKTLARIDGQSNQ